MLLKLWISPPLLDRVDGRARRLEPRAPEVIATYARHPETGEPVPAALVEGLALAQAIEDVPYVARYIQLARIDLAQGGQHGGGRPAGREGGRQVAEEPRAAQAAAAHDHARRWPRSAGAAGQSRCQPRPGLPVGPRPRPAPAGPGRGHKPVTAGDACRLPAEGNWQQTGCPRRFDGFSVWSRTGVSISIPRADRGGLR